MNTPATGLEAVDALFAQLSTTYNPARDALRIRKEEAGRLADCLEAALAGSPAKIEIKPLRSALVRYYSPSARHGGQKAGTMVRKHLARIQSALRD